MREFLKGLDLDSETIDTIMAEYGKNVQGLKEQIEEYKGYKSQNADLSKQLKAKEDSIKNYEQVTKENTDLKAQLQMSGSGVKKEFSKFVTSEILAQVDDKKDFETVLKDYKKDNPQYFGETTVKKTQTSPLLGGEGSQGTTTNDIMNNILRGSRNSVE